MFIHSKGPRGMRNFLGGPQCRHHISEGLPERSKPYRFSELLNAAGIVCRRSAGNIVTKSYISILFSLT